MGQVHTERQYRSSRIHIDDGDKGNDDEGGDDDEGDDDSDEDDGDVDKYDDGDEDDDGFSLPHVETQTC